MKQRIIRALVIIAILLSVATPVFAIALPDSTPTVERFNVYRNLLETDDMLVLIYANIPYTSVPDTPVTAAYIWRLFSADGLTEHGSTVGYAYNDNGYGYNVYSLYFSAATAPTWGESFIVKLSGNPAAFTTPPVYNYTISASDYSSLTDSSDVQAELAARVLNMATDLNNKWGLATAYWLTTSTEEGTKLSLYGEAVFRGAIYGLQNLAPVVFQAVRRNIENADRTWSDNYTVSLSNQYSGTYIDTAKAAMQELFKTDWDMFSMILALALAFGILIANIMLSGDSWSGLIDAMLVMVICARLGMYGLGFLGILEALCFLYIAVKFKQMGVFGT